MYKLYAFFFGIFLIIFPLYLLSRIEGSQWEVYMAVYTIFMCCTLGILIPIAFVQGNISWWIVRYVVCGVFFFLLYVYQREGIFSVLQSVGIAFGGTVLVYSFIFVEKGSSRILYRMGKPVKNLSYGWHIIVPFVEYVRPGNITLKE